MCTVGGTAPAPAAARRWAARAPPDEGGDEHALDPPEAARRGPDDGPRERAARARGGGACPLPHHLAVNETTDGTTTGQYDDGDEGEDGTTKTAR